MERKLQNKLIKEFPKLFKDLCYGFDCDNGWYDLIRDLCLAIKENDPDETVRVYRVKEKLGGLRFYINTGSNEVYDLISIAGSKSFKICEECGKPGECMIADAWWFKTLCDECGVKLGYNKITGEEDYI